MSSFKVAAGIVLYNPDMDELAENVNRVLGQVDKVILIDNNSSDISEIRKIYGALDKVILIENRENLGVAKALNQIVDYCDENGYDWVLTLDQDSFCPDNIIEEYKKYTSFDKVALITPKIFDIGSNRYITESLHEDFEYVQKCITSAAFTNVKICKDLFAFDERLFIDYVDFDYCARVIRNGYKILQVNGVMLYHSLGKSTCICSLQLIKDILTKLHIHTFTYKSYVSNHSPFRTFYIVRNVVYYLHEYKDVLDVKMEKKRVLRWLLYKILFEKQRIKKGKAMIKGYIAGKKLIKENDMNE